MIANKLYWFWGITETATAVFLIQGISNWVQLMAFLASHGLTIALTYMIFGVLIGSDPQLRNQVLTKGFIIFLITISIVPLIGPGTMLFIAIFLRFFPLYPVRTESYQKVNREVLINIQQKLQARTIPLTEALLIRQLPRDMALRMLGIIDEMDWTATKSSILRYVIRLSPYQNIVLMAIDIMKKKTDAILSEITQLEGSGKKTHENFNTLSNLYHELCYLDLLEPLMKQTYLNKACGYALDCYHLRDHNEDDALLAVRYLLEANRVEEAHEIYNTVRSKGDYFFPKWVTYELEISVKKSDEVLFNNLYLLIESGGGVFIPDKVKEAAKAWKKVLTSAWL
jgi:hypothetical protein